MTDVPEADAQEQSELVDGADEEAAVAPASRSADVPVEDALEQAAPVRSGPAAAAGGPAAEASEADWLEQTVEEPYDDYED